MKKYKINLFKFFPIILLGLFSCDDYLDLRPVDELIQQDFWKTEQHVSSAVIGCYASMTESALTDRILKWGELRGEMLIAGGGAERDDTRMMQNFILPSNSLLNWSSFYNTINKCNVVLEFADDAQANDLSFSEDDLNTYKAEVTTIRALMYTILVKNFKEVPLVTEATVDSNVEYFPAKSSEEEIIKRIIDDLTKKDENGKSVIDNLKTGYSESIAHDKGRMTKGAAFAILADIYLWSEQYDECIDACDQIQALNKYSLVNGSQWFFSIFSQGNSVESIFELQFDETNINTTYRNAFNVDSSVPDFAPYTGIDELYHENIDLFDERGRLGSFELQLNSVFKHAGFSRIGLVRNSGFYTNNFIFYRYADVLLMKAEAYALSETKKDLNLAYNLTNQVHLRSTGISLDTDGSVLNQILLERQKEFAFEGKRWYDILRFAKRNNFERQDLILDLVDIKSGVDNFEQILSYYSDTESYYLPIFTNELNLNVNLEQNPYYIN